MSAPVHPSKSGTHSDLLESLKHIEALSTNTNLPYRELKARVEQIHRLAASAVTEHQPKKRRTPPLS